MSASDDGLAIAAVGWHGSSIVVDGHVPLAAVHDGSMHMRVQATAR